MGCKCSNNEKEGKPEKLEFGLVDWIKAFISWMRSYRKTYSIEPGLYYTGQEYNNKTPLLVTCNYHMTVFLLWRILKNRNVRLLVIDTKGINVWCSAGKGQFSSSRILDQLAKYDKKILTENDKLEIILPKLSLSGVRLSLLRQANIKPVIGPVYAQDLPKYLDDQIKDCTDDHYKFNLRNRLFTLFPSFLQFIKYLAITTAVLLLMHIIFNTGFWWQILPVSLSIPILYIILFPVLPSRNFSLKGIALFLMQMLILIVQQVGILI